MLEDGSRSSRTQQSQVASGGSVSGTNANGSSSRTRDRDRDRDRTKDVKDDRKGKAISRTEDGVGATSQTSSAVTVASVTTATVSVATVAASTVAGDTSSTVVGAVDDDSTKRSEFGERRRASTITSDAAPQFTNVTSERKMSNASGFAADDTFNPWDLDIYSSRYGHRGSIARRALGSVGSLDDPPIVRTSHAEAFATLDPHFLDMLRARAATNMDAYHASDQDSQSSSRLRGIKRLFHPQGKTGSKGSGSIQVGPHVPVLEGHYTPPWLTMAARSKQEEQERVIKNLNDSFRDVGLLPSLKPTGRSNRQKAKGKRSSGNVFDQIPDDALYMLLPMWPGETEDWKNQPDVQGMYEVPLHERQYLLVYYVPMLDKEKDREEKKRSRPSQTSSGNSTHHSDSGTSREHKNTVSLQAFNILARLVSYNDVNGSGIRVPTSGLAVTGPIDQAMNEIPTVRFEVDDLALIIGFCDKRERGVEFLPEGAEKLGLCTPRNFSALDQDLDSDAPLSSLGRAAVEMAWLGALSVMGFGAPATQSL